MKISPLIALCTAIAVMTAAMAQAIAAPTPPPAKASPRPAAAHTPKIWLARLYVILRPEPDLDSM